MANNSADNRWSGAEHIDVDPYAALASIYDRVMSHVDYSGWADFTDKILTDYDLQRCNDGSSPLILECACGTGIIAGMLAMKGYRIDAFDGSPAMVEIAKSKNVDALNPPKYYVTDFLDLDAVDCYNAVICLYDSINYIMDLNSVNGFFQRVHRALKTDGLFLFDVCTEWNSKVHFASGEIIEHGEDFVFSRIMKYDSRRKLQENKFFISLSESKDKVFVEKHRQRIHDLDKLREIVASCGFSLLEETDEYRRIPPNERSLRVHFLCRRE